MSPRDKRDVTDLHRQLMDRFPLAFPKDYDALRPLKLGIHTDILHAGRSRSRPVAPGAGQPHPPGRLPVGPAPPSGRPPLRSGRPTRRHGDPGGARRSGPRRPSAGRPRPNRCAAPGPRGAAPPATGREQRHREAKAARKAEHARVQQEIAARKAALLAQGIMPESRAERKRRLAREAAPGPRFRPRAETRPSSNVVPRPRRPRPPPARPRGCRIAPNPRRPRRCRPSSSGRSAESCRPTNQDRPNPRTGSRDTVSGWPDICCDLQKWMQIITEVAANQ